MSACQAAAIKLVKCPAVRPLLSNLSSVRLAAAIKPKVSDGQAAAIKPEVSGCQAAAIKLVKCAAVRPLLSNLKCPAVRPLLSNLSSVRLAAAIKPGLSGQLVLGSVVHMSGILDSFPTHMVYWIRYLNSILYSGLSMYPYTLPRSP